MTAPCEQSSGWIAKRPVIADPITG
jgi:hypothetical protein